MMRLAKPTAAGAVLVLLAFAAAASSALSSASRVSARPQYLDEATVIVEVNSTEGDAGIQFFLDGEPWRTMRVTGPPGTGSRKLVQIDTKGRLKRHGLTELFSESSEPSFEELPLDVFKKRFPEGTYRFAGRTIAGRKLVGAAELSHAIPNGPKIISPAEGSEIDRSNVALQWRPGPQPTNVDIVAYRAIVEREDPLRVFSVDLRSPVTHMTVPKQFLEPGTEYLFELQAIERSGNITFSEAHFSVS